MTWRSWTSRAVIGSAAVALGVVTLMHAAIGDVSVYRDGARAVLAGASPYEFRHGSNGFSYPPFAAVVFVTLAWLPTALMWAVLVCVSAGALAVVVRLSAPLLLSRSRLRDAGVVGALLLLQPVESTLRWGQVNLVLAALVMADVLVLRRGVLVGLAAAVKLTPGLFVVYLLVTGRRREARNGAVTFLAVTAATWGAAPRASARFWTHEMFTASGIGGTFGPSNQSVAGLAHRLLGPSAATTVWLASAVPVLVLGLAIARHLGGRGAEVAAVGVVGVTACLVSPVSWNHHWVWVVPLLASCVEAGVRRRVLLPCFGLLGMWTFFPPDWEHGTWLQPLGTAYVPVALVAGCAAAVRLLRGRARTAVRDGDPLVRLEP